MMMFMQEVRYVITTFSRFSEPCCRQVQVEGETHPASTTEASCASRDMDRCSFFESNNFVFCNLNWKRLICKIICP
jgi:hypothetical protein